MVREVCFYFLFFPLAIISSFQLHSLASLSSSSLLASSLWKSRNHQPFRTFRNIVHESPDTMDVTRDNTFHSRMVVIFGRPGSGKTTIATMVHDQINHRMKIKESKSINSHHLDLDICIPTWMKENFVKGIYPTHAERIEFANQACDYVDQEVQIFAKHCNLNKKDITSIPTIQLVSFSFVNEDIRAVYRERFPDAIWVLIDTDEIEAQRRISLREGHFYSGKPLTNELKCDEITDSQSAFERDDDEWSFAPVTFHHVRLDGRNTAEENAQHILGRIEGDSCIGK
jgi:gluconate kinase